jgi:enoyl-CoA hydratase/carnithine racemase
LTLALACDFRIAADSARLGDTSGKFALLPDEGGAWFFPRAMGLDRALKMIQFQRKPDNTYIYGTYLRNDPMMPINRPGQRVHAAALGLIIQVQVVNLDHRLGAWTN